jgi:two-component system chemotaxis sensor kinase CheA
MDEFKQAFLEESRENLVDLETSLLALNESPTDMELVGRAFRALHTIKGTGSMLGFDKLTAFTHAIENVFDEVRNGRVLVTSELINCSLSSIDQIKAMLDETVGQVVASDEISAKILAGFRKLTGAVEKLAAKAELAPPSASIAPSDGPQCNWNIHFSPGAEFMLRTDPLSLLRDLRALGTLQVLVSMAEVPLLAELDPKRCYLIWELLLNTSASRQTILEVFIFVEDICNFLIQPGSEHLVTPIAKAAIDASPEHFVIADAKPATEPAKGVATKYGRRASDQPDSPSSLRVPAAKLDKFLNLVGELVTVQARLAEVAARSEDPEIGAVSEEVERLTSTVREQSMSIRMVQIRTTFERFRRLVHDLARDLHKEVELTIQGAETELDKTVIDELNDPLMHLVRNSMDHGIESAEARLAAGKPAIARIHLSAMYSGASVLIAIADDGAGINAQAVRERAVEKGLVAADAQLSESAIFALILAPGFSTAKIITDVSGRGVGMDVVKRKVEALRGTINITSKPGIGTTVTLQLPLTLAIIDGLLVRVGEAYFVLPLASTLECIELTRQDIERANGKHVAYIRGEMIPYLRLREYFHIEMERPEREQVMIAETDEGRFGFVVDQVLGDCQTVIKNLGRVYRHVSLVSGATILGNGTVALILDPNRLVQDALRTQTQRRRVDMPMLRPLRRVTAVKSGGSSEALVEEMAAAHTNDVAGNFIDVKRQSSI